MGKESNMAPNLLSIDAENAGGDTVVGGDEFYLGLTVFGVTFFRAI